MKIIRPFITIIITLIVIGVFALAINTAFGNQTITYLEKIPIEATGIGRIGYYYKFDFNNYINNLTLSISNVSKLEFKLPTRQFNGTLSNDIIVVSNYLIIIANALLYPIRIASYLIRNILAFLGVNTDITNEYNGFAWLIEATEALISETWIPYL